MIEMDVYNLIFECSILELNLWLSLKTHVNLLIYNVSIVRHIWLDFQMKSSFPHQ